MDLIRNQVAEIGLYLTKDGEPVIGLTHESVTVGLKKTGGASFTPKALDEDSFVEVSDGVYSLFLSITDTNTLGALLILVEGDDIDPLFQQARIVLSPAPSPLIPPEMCVVHGSVLDYGGAPAQQLKVTAQPIRFPARHGNHILAADAVYTYPNADGEFDIVLVRNSVVLVEIERCGLRAQITVPDAANANLIDLLPPIPNDYTDPA